MIGVLRGIEYSSTHSGVENAFHRLYHGCDRGYWASKPSAFKIWGVISKGINRCDRGYLTSKPPALRVSGPGINHKRMLPLALLLGWT